MGRGRFNAVDVRAMTWELSHLLVGLRVSNIYDINNRSYLLKFSGDDQRLLLMIENGVRFHLTSFTRDATQKGMPNGFCQRLRKHLRGRRLTKVNQIGRDKIAVFTFGTNPDFQLHLILELHSSGNMILTDQNSIVLANLKTVISPVIEITKEEAEEEEGREIGEETAVISEMTHRETAKKRIKTVKMKEFYDLYGNTLPDEPQSPSIIEDLLRKELHKLIRNEKYLTRLQSHLRSGSISKRKLRKIEKSFGMSDCTVTVSDFLAKKLNCAPMYIHAILNEVNQSKPTENDLNGQDSLLELALKPYPLFEGGSEKLTQLLESMSDEVDSEEEESMNEDELTESRALYDGMTEAEKIQYMRLDSNKLGILFACVEQFEHLMRSMKVTSDVPSEMSTEMSIRGCIISKGVNLSKKQGRVKVKVKAERRKKEAPMIELEKSSVQSESNQKSSLEVTFDSTDASGEKRVITDMDSVSEEKKEIRWMYDEFVPLMDCPISDLQKCISFESFAECIDEFYASTESLKQDMKQARSQALAWAKLEKARRQHDRHIDKLKCLADTEEMKAESIRENLSLVDSAIDAVNGLLNEGVDWNDIAYLIKAGKESGNPVSCAITALKLHDSKISMKLTHKVAIYDESESEPIDWTEESVILDIDLSMNAWNNAGIYFSKKKVSLQKKEKTEEKTTSVIESAEIRTRRLLERDEEMSAISKVRKAYWFEKFYWFISSDGFLVISGRDAQQNELIVKRYMDKTVDLYIHAQVHGASSVVIKNHYSDPSIEIPATTLIEAGHFCVCRSVAWRNGVTLQSYYVKASQVSKTAPTGEYVPTGSFIIRGKKKFIPPGKLEMALTLLFKIDSDSAHSNHRNERCIDSESTDHVKMTEILREMDTSVGPLKKESEVTVTRTLVHLTPKDKALQKQMREEKESMAKLTAKERRELRKKKKKAKKYGMKSVDQIAAPAMNSSAKRGRRKGRSKYIRKYGREDQSLVEELLGIKRDEEREEESEGKETDKNEEGLPLAERDQLSSKQNRWNVVDLEDSDESEDEETQRDRRRLGESLSEQLTLLTGRPQPTDHIEFALAMCAPVQSIDRKYIDPMTGHSSRLYDTLIKIQPGSVKRGNAVKTVKRMLEQNCDDWLENFIKVIPLPEISLQFLSDVKLSAPGLRSIEEQLQRKANAAAKQKWKQRQIQEQAAIDAAKQRREELAHVAPKKRSKILRNARKKGK